MAKKKEEEITCESFIDQQPMHERSKWTLKHMHGKERYTLTDWKSIFRKLGLA
jgi:hypothetical protein